MNADSGKSLNRGERKERRGQMEGGFVGRMDKGPKGGMEEFGPGADRARRSERQQVETACLADSPRSEILPLLSACIGVHRRFIPPGRSSCPLAPFVSWW